MHHPTDRMTHTTAFVTPVVDHWLEREIVSGAQHQPPTADYDVCLVGWLIGVLFFGGFLTSSFFLESKVNFIKSSISY